MVDEAQTIHRRTNHCCIERWEAGVKVDELCRKHGMSQATYYAWKAKFGGMSADEVRRLRQLEDENRRIKHLVADLNLDNQMLRASSEKKW